MLDIRASSFFDTPHMRLVEFVGGCLSLLVHSPWPRFHIDNLIFLSISIIFFHSIEEHVDNHDTDHGTPWRIALDLQGDPANDWLKSQVTKEPRARAQNEKEHLHYCHHMISLQQYIANDSKDGVLCNYYVQNIPTTGVYCNRRVKYALLVCDHLFLYSIICGTYMKLIWLSQHYSWSWDVMITTLYWIYMMILPWKFAWWHTKNISLKHYFRGSGVSTTTNVSHNISFDIGICTFKGPKAKKALYFWCIKRLVYNGRTSLNAGNCTLVNTSNFISIWHAYFIDFNTCHALFSYTYWDSNITCRVAIGITMLVPPPI